MNEFNLKNTIMIKGNQVNSLQYDLDAIDENALLDAISNCHFGDEFFAALPDNDFSFHLWLMFEAITKNNSDIDVSDLRRISGADCVRLTNIGTTFFSNVTAENDFVEVSLGKLLINPDSLTVDMYMDADTESRKYANQIHKPSIFMAGNDMALHLFVGYKILDASNDGITMDQLRQLRGEDLIKVLKVGRNFITVTLAEEYIAGSPQENSDKLYEDIPEHITAE